MGLIYRELGPFSLPFFDLFCSPYVIYSLKPVPSSLFPFILFSSTNSPPQCLKCFSVEDMWDFLFFLASFISFLALLVTVSGHRREKRRERGKERAAPISRAYIVSQAAGSNA